LKQGEEESADMGRDGAQSELGVDGEEAAEQSDIEKTESDPDQDIAKPAQSNDEMIVQLSQLASQFSQTVDKLRMVSAGSSLKSTHHVHAHNEYDVFNLKRKGTLKFSTQRNAPEIIPCTQ
jgi:hypothetical protein